MGKSKWLIFGFVYVGVVIVALIVGAIIVFSHENVELKNKLEKQVGSLGGEVTCGSSNCVARLTYSGIAFAIKEKPGASKTKPSLTVKMLVPLGFNMDITPYWREIWPTKPFIGRGIIKVADTGDPAFNEKYLVIADDGESAAKFFHAPAAMDALKYFDQIGLYEMIADDDGVGVEISGSDVLEMKQETIMSHMDELGKLNALALPRPPESSSASLVRISTYKWRRVAAGVSLISMIIIPPVILILGGARIFSMLGRKKLAPVAVELGAELVTHFLYPPALRMTVDGLTALVTTGKEGRRYGPDLIYYRFDSRSPATPGLDLKIYPALDNAQTGENFVVSGSDPAKTAMFLEGPEVRETLRYLFGNGFKEVVFDRKGLSAKFFDARDISVRADRTREHLYHLRKLMIG